MLQIIGIFASMSTMAALSTSTRRLLTPLRTSSSHTLCSFLTSINEGSCSSSFRMVTSRQKIRALHMTYSSSSSAGQGFGKEATKTPSSKDTWKIVDVPLVFVPGMKGTHLAFDDDAPSETNTSGSGKAKKKNRAWLTLGNLLNFPPRADNDPSRDLSLPLTYDYDPPSEGEAGHEFAAHYPRQHIGELKPDGIVDHIIELNNGGDTTNYVDLNFLPFYGHTTRMLREIDKEYHARRHDGKVETTESFERQDDEFTDETVISKRIGSFVEKTSNWAFSNGTTTNSNTAEEQQSHHALKHCRPTAVFSYDWRRPLPELCTALHEFVEETFPDQPVQIIAHSLGGLMSFAAMREHPEKYAPGAVIVGVPFETGIQ